MALELPFPQRRVGVVGVPDCDLSPLNRNVDQGLRITIAKLGYMRSFVSRANPDFCRTVLRLFDSVVTNTAHCYLRNIILISYIFHENPRKRREKWCVSPGTLTHRKAGRICLCTAYVRRMSSRT